MRFPVLWVVMVRAAKDLDFVIHSEHKSRALAREECRSVIRDWVGKGNAYVQKFGPIS